MINLRPATINDLQLLKYWDEQPHIIAANPNDPWNWEEELGQNIPWIEQFIAEIDCRPLGFIQIMNPALDENQYWGEVSANLRAIDIWIGEEANLRKGYGTQMMQLALNRCFANPVVTGVLIDPLSNNTRAHRFYEHLGFKLIEKRNFGNDECFVYLLNRANWQK